MKGKSYFTRGAGARVVCLRCAQRHRIARELVRELERRLLWRHAELRELRRQLAARGGEAA